MAWINGLDDIYKENFFGSFKFKSERKMEDYIWENWDMFFNFKNPIRQFHVNGGSNRVDLFACGKFKNENDRKNMNRYYIELKVHPYKLSDEFQLMNYLKPLKLFHQISSVFTDVGILINYDRGFLFPRKVRVRVNKREIWHTE